MGTMKKMFVAAALGLGFIVLGVMLGDRDAMFGQERCRVEVVSGTGTGNPWFVIVDGDTASYHSRSQTANRAATDTLESRPTASVEVHARFAVRWDNPTCGEPVPEEPTDTLGAMSISLLPMGMIGLHWTPEGYNGSILPDGTKLVADTVVSPFSLLIPMDSASTTYGFESYEVIRYEGMPGRAFACSVPVAVWDSVTQDVNEAGWDRWSFFHTGPRFMEIVASADSTATCPLSGGLTIEEACHVRTSTACESCTEAPTLTPTADEDQTWILTGDECPSQQDDLPSLAVQ